MPNEHRRRLPYLGVTILQAHDTAIRRYARMSGLSISRIIREIITFAITHGYTPGSVSVAEMRADARASIQQPKEE